MDMKRIEDLSREELIKRLRLACELASAVDGLWFLAAEQAEGFDKALAMDVQVWERYASLCIKRIRKYYPIGSNGLDAFKEIMRIDPLWLHVEFELIGESKDRLTFQVNKCPFLEAMERMGRPVLTCEPVETAYLTAMAQALDPRIRVQPIKLPPRKSKDEICCQWLLSLDQASFLPAPGPGATP